tara:strand:- start:98 stop:940 length:843 start_codon:yes stop_codon:yes gene_type:complete
MNKKHNRNKLQSLVKDIKKGFSRLYWFSYTFLKYYYFNLKFKLKKKKIINYGISVLVPTKNRSLKFKRMIETLINKKSKDFDIELLILFDENESEISSYLKTIEIYKKYIDISFFHKNFVRNSERINFLATKSKHQIILLINDDLNFCLENWNKVICKEFSKINMKKPFSLWLATDDVKYKYFHSNFPVINKTWHDKLGYHSPSKYFQHWWSDNWICDLGKKSGKFLISKEIFFTHYNKFQKNQLDSLYVENENKRNGKKDYDNWLKLNSVRKTDAKKLI